MILLDANLLVYAHASESPHHEPARAWFEEVMNAPERVGFPWPTLLAFVRLMGNANVMRRPVPLRDAWARAESWLALPQSWIPVPTERHQELLTGLLDGETRADVANDAHLAALAIEHGLTVCSSDRDFSRFRGIRWENPLSRR
ncbi:MAG TPA: type II toxin-antitoxin system VapC family toxin [Conexibacter sp.]|nr:type II toxin-antitoxin system VapC family toxin [Conexibacter sp.]